MSVTIPFVFVGGAGNKARASDVNANFSALAAKFTEGAGGIANADISSTAGIKAIKLSTTPGDRITQAQLDDDAVDQRVLRDDITAGAPNAAVNTAAHIKDAIITNLKIVPGAIAADRLKITEVTQAFSFPATGTGNSETFTKAIAPSPALPLMSAMLPLRATIEGYTVSGPGGAGQGAHVEVYNTIGATTYALIFNYTGTFAGAMTIAGTIRFTYLDLT